MILARRISKLERTVTLMRENRLILRFEGPGSKRMPQPTKEEIADGLEILTVRFVAAKDGRPA
jgi:hypothetical protein